MLPSPTQMLTVGHSSLLICTQPLVHPHFGSSAKTWWQLPAQQLHISGNGNMGWVVLIWGPKRQWVHSPCVAGMSAGNFSWVAALWQQGVLFTLHLQYPIHGCDEFLLVFDIMAHVQSFGRGSIFNCSQPKNDTTSLCWDVHPSVLEMVNIDP